MVTLLRCLLRYVIFELGSLLWQLPWLNFFLRLSFTPLPESRLSNWSCLIDLHLFNLSFILLYHCLLLYLFLFYFLLSLLDTLKLFLPQVVRRCNASRIEPLSESSASLLDKRQVILVQQVYLLLKFCNTIKQDLQRNKALFSIAKLKLPQ